MGEKCCFRSKRMRSVLPRNSSSSMGERCEGFQRATADIRLFSGPLVASAEAKFPAFRKKQLCLKDQPFGRAHLARHSINSRKSSLGALLRKRKVTGRDASLPAPLLSAFGILVARGTVGALPQTPQGTLSLDPARGRRKGTKSPLDPFSRLSWSRFHAPSACSFLVLRLSPCLLPQLSVKNQKIHPRRRKGGQV